MGIFDFFKGNKKEISNDNFLLENLIFPNINGIDFINAETKSSNIKKSLEDDVDGKWYYSQSPLICLMKSVSPSIFGDELDKLLTANNLKYSNHRIRNNIKYWDFEVENNVKETENKTLKYSIEAYTSKEISMITIINLSMADINSIKLRDTNLTSKKHNEKWVKGLDIFDGEEVINKDNTLFKAQNVPLLFYESDLTYILIPHIPHILIAKQIIDVIIKENGGADSFKKLEEEGWEYLHSCNNFIVGYVTEHSVVRLNKQAVIEETEVEKDLNYLYKSEAKKDLNYHYKRVTFHKDRLKRLLEMIAPAVLLRNEKKVLQDAVDDFLALSNKESVKTEFQDQINEIKEMLPEIKEMISKIEGIEAKQKAFEAKEKADEAKVEFKADVSKQPESPVKSIDDLNLDPEVVINWIYGINKAFNYKEKKFEENLIFYKYEEDKGCHIVYKGVNTFYEGYDFIDQIIRENGGENNFKRQQDQDGYEYIYIGDLFNISYFKSSGIVEIKKVEEFTFVDKSIKLGINENDIKIRSLIDGLDKILYNEGEGPSNGRLCVRNSFVFAYFNKLNESLDLFKKIVINYDKDHQVFQKSNKKLDELINSGGITYNNDLFELMLIRENVKYKFYITPPGGFFSKWFFKGNKKEKGNSAKEEPAKEKTENFVEKKVCYHINSKGKTYHLHSKDVVLIGGRNQTIYYFAKDLRPNACSLPSGKTVVENTKTGVPFLADTAKKNPESIEEINEQISIKKNLIAEAKALIKKYTEQQKNVRNNREEEKKLGIRASSTREFDSLTKETEYQELEIQLAEKNIKEFKAQLEQKNESIDEIKSISSENPKHLENENKNTGHILVKIDEESFFEPKSEEKTDDTTKETRYWILYNGYIIKGQGDPYDGTLIYELSLKVAQEDPEDVDYESDYYEHYILEGSIYHFDKDLQYTLNSSELDQDDDDWGELIYYNINLGAFSPDSEGVIPTPQTKSGDVYVNFEESGEFYVNWEDCFNKKEALLKIKEIEDKLVKETAKHYEVSKLKEAKKEKQVFEHINSEGKTFYLTYKDVVMGGRSRTIYFFSKDIGPNACDLPSGKCVVENQKTRLPFLKDISANEEELENDIWAVGTYSHYYFLKKAKISDEENNGHPAGEYTNEGNPLRTTKIRIGEFDSEGDAGDWNTAFIDFFEIDIDYYSGKVVDHDLNESYFEKLQQQFGLELDDFYKDNIEWDELRESERFTFKKESEADKEFEKQINLCLKEAAEESAKEDDDRNT